MIDTSTECARKWWMISAVVGVVVAFIAGAVLGVPWFGSILLGVIVGGVMGYVTVRSQCSEADVETARPATPSSSASSSRPTAPGAKASGPTTTGTTASGGTASGATTTGGATAATPGAAPGGAAPTPPGGPSSAPTGAGPTETPAATGSTKATPPPAEPPARDSAVPGPGEDSAGSKPAAPASGPGGAFLDAPRGGKADDLKLIKGIGPKLEERLNSLGLYHHDQIAALTEAQIAHIDEQLDLRGRITRDDWVGQAAALAKKSS